MRVVAISMVLAAGLLGASPASSQVSRGGSGPGAIPSLPDTQPAERPPATGSINTGKVKPPGSPVGEARGTRPDLERRAEELDRRIRTGICRGC